MKSNKLRPNIKTIRNNDETSAIELFQNNTLRPILKLQHDLGLTIFKQHCIKIRIMVSNLGKDEKVNLIQNTLSKNHTIRNQFIGIIIGHFNLEELSTYYQSEREFNRRIIQMLKQRIISNFVV